MIIPLASEISLDDACKEYALNQARITILRHVAFPRARQPHARTKLGPVLHKHPELHIDYFKAVMSARNYLADNLDEIPLITKCILLYRDHITPQNRLERKHIARRLYELKVEDAALMHSLVKLYDRKQYLKGDVKAKLKKGRIRPLEATRAIVSTAITLLAGLVKKPDTPTLIATSPDQLQSKE